MSKRGVTPDELIFYVRQKLAVVIRTAAPASNCIYILHTALYLVHRNWFLAPYKFIRFTQGSYWFILHRVLTHT